MMKEDYKDIFKRHFDTHHVDTDPEEMWQAIRAKKSGRPSRKRKKRRWLMIIPLVVAVGFLVAFFVQKLEPKKSESTPTASSELMTDLVGDSTDKKLNAQGKYEKEESHLTKVGEIINDDSKGNVERKTESLNGNTIVSQTKLIQITEGQELDVAKKKEVTDLIKRGEGTGLVAEGTTIISGTVKQNTASSDGVEYEDAVVQKTEKVLEVSSLNSNGEGAEAVNNFKKGTAQNDDVETIIQDVDKKRIALFLVRRDIRDLTLSSLNSVNKMPVLAVLEQATIVKRGEEGGLDRGRLSLLIGGSYGVLSTSYKGIDSAADAYALKRDATESSLEAISSSLMVDYRLHENLSLSAGIGYTRFNELFEWGGTSVRDSYGEYHSSTEEYPDGQVDFINSTGEYQELVTTKMKIYNKMEVISVPVQLNVQKSMGDFKVSMMGGLSANFIVGEEGYVLASDDGVLELGTEASKLGVTLRGGLGLEYSINEKLGLAGNVAYSQLRKEQLGLAISYGIVDLGLALRYKF